MYTVIVHIGAYSEEINVCLIRVHSNILSDDAYIGSVGIYAVTSNLMPYGIRKKSIYIFQATILNIHLLLSVI